MKNQENRFTVTLDFHQFKSKPTSLQTSAIINRMQNNILHNDLAELYTDQLHYLCSTGHTIAPATFKKTAIKNRCWKSQQVFFIDIDERLPVKIALKKYEDVNLQPNFWYFTSSNKTSKEDRYRLVYVLDQPIKNPDRAKAIYQRLINLYPETDNVATSLSNIFYGGYGGETIKPDYTSTLDLELFTSDTKFTSQQTQKVDTNLKNYQYSGISESYRKQLETTRKKGKDWKPLLYKNSKIYRAFDDGKYLKYEELRPLVTSLIHLRGGYTYMLNRMRKYINRNNRYKQDDLDLIVKANRAKAPPEKLIVSNLRPEFHPDANHYSIYHIYKFNSQTVQAIDTEKEYISIEKAEDQLNKSFDEALKQEKSINIIKAQTALGKSKMLLEQAPKHTPLVIANPDHSLKEDVYTDFYNSGYEDVLITTGLPTFKQGNLNYKISQAYQYGCYSFASKLIHNTAKAVNDLNDNESIQDLNSTDIKEDAEQAQAFLNYEKKVKDYPNIVLTTHAKLSHNNFNATNYIYDEDPLLNNIIQTDSIQIKELSNLQYIVGSNHNDIYKYFQQLEDQCFIPTPDFEYNSKQILHDYNRQYKDREGLAPPIFKLLDSDMIYRDDTTITFYSYSMPDPEKNINILSATAPLNVYKVLFPNRINVMDVPRAKHKGTVKQFNRYSYSKSSINNLLASKDKNEFLSNIKNPHWQTITFDQFKNIFMNPDEDTNLFNCTGKNHLTGKNINIVGTPHLPENIYKFIYFIITGETIEDEIKERLINFNGYRFKFPTYKNELLQTIQLDLIHSQLLQAIGRARTLRTDAEVHVYSNLITGLTDSIEEGIILN